MPSLHLGLQLSDGDWNGGSAPSAAFTLGSDSTGLRMQLRPPPLELVSGHPRPAPATQVLFQQLQQREPQKPLSPVTGPGWSHEARVLVQDGGAGHKGSSAILQAS